MRLRLSIVLLAAVVAAFGQSAAPAKPAAPAKAAAAQQTPPPPGPVRPFQFPKHETRRLTNGLTVFVIEDHRLPLVSYRLEIPAAGASANDPKHAGLASMTAGLLREGTKTRSAQQIAAAIDRMGASLNTYAGADTASINASAMKSFSPPVLELMADVVLNPVFAQEEVDRNIRQALSNMQVQFADPQSVAQMVTQRVGFGEHPYALPVGGTPDTLRAIKREDIAKFYETHYGPEGSYLAIAGDVNPADAFAAAEKHFGAWKRSVAAISVAAVKPSTARRVVIIDKPDAVQTQFGLAQVAIPRNHPDNTALQIANQIFGGSFNSRLNMRLRANEGLTYGASSMFETLRHSGLFRAASFTRTDSTGKAVTLMSDLLRELLENPITDQELNEAKAYLAGSFVIAVETPDAVAGRVLISAIHGLPDNYWQNYRERVLATTREDVIAALKRNVTPANMSIVAVGNASQIRKELAGFGPVQVVPLADLDLTAPNLMRAKEAAGPVTAESKASAMNLIKAAVEAHGGAQALASVKGLQSKASMSVSMMGQNMKMETEETLVYPSQYRLELTLPMGKVVQAFDGKTMWMQQGTQSREMPPAMAGEAVLGIERGAAGLGLLRSALDGSAEVTAIDAVEHEGRKLPTVQWKKGDLTAKISFDPETKRVARISHRGATMTGPADVDVYPSDYTDVAGVLLPNKEVIFQNGQKFAEVTYTQRAVNPPSSPEMFAKPAA